MKLFVRRAIPLISFLACSVLFSSAQVKPQRVRVSSGVAQGLLVSKVDPTYPELARQARIQGDVTLKILVNTSGDVETADLISGHPMLAPAAIDAVKKWKYRPYLLNGEAIAMETQVSVNFALTHNQPDQANPSRAANSASLPAGSLESVAMDPLVGPVLQTVRVPSSEERTLIVKKIAPIYPEEARRNYIEGTVLMKVIISKQGDVVSIHAISGDPALVASAMEAVRQWKYKPYLLNGTPVDVETQVQVNFALSKK